MTSQQTSNSARFRVHLRAKATFGTDVEVIDVYPGQNP